MTSATPPAHAKPPLWARVVAVLLSLVLSLVMAEVVAGIVRHHAFPILNLYLEDAALGVRLEPSASTHLRSRTGNVTSVRTNRLGFRGDEWRPAAGGVVRGRVLLLGDSQVFGYGVEEDEALAAQLQAELGPSFEVLSAATPSWGPPELATVLAELAPIYRPEIVVFVANVANDWSEVKVPNRLRTTARDGWARTVIANQDDTVSDFPGRRFLLGKSHLVYALRTLLRGAPDAAEAALATSATRLVKDLPWLAQPDGENRSRLTRVVLRMADTCKPLGCTLVTAGLPLDVQVHPSEWQKYRGEIPIDVGGTYRLLGTLLAELHQHGLAVLDLLPALRATSPGAFQVDDYHLSARGHAAIAHALAPTLRERRPGDRR